MTTHFVNHYLLDLRIIVILEDRGNPILPIQVSSSKNLDCPYNSPSLLQTLQQFPQDNLDEMEANRLTMLTTLEMVEGLETVAMTIPTMIIIMTTKPIWRICY